MRELYGSLSRGELAMLAAAVAALVVWAAIGPKGVLEGVLPALLAGLACGVIIGLNRRRTSRDR